MSFFANAGVLLQRAPNLAKNRFAPIDVFLVGDADVQQGARPIARRVGDDGDRAVGDDVRRAVDVPQHGRAEVDGLHLARAAGGCDRVPDADLILQQDEKSGDDILDERLRAEADGESEDPSTRQDRFQSTPNLASTSIRVIDQTSTDDACRRMRLIVCARFSSSVTMLDRRRRESSRCGG
jgi:hypothetical protein